ncbi:hypothetical protein H4Q26_014284 [Puccinia striiformis f. sp. tritici PST-130]|nr:hypothetical protein H4Q26_014284 [Puccinia striiformis f. sp. tritici PST-130]
MGFPRGSKQLLPIKDFFDDLHPSSSSSSVKSNEAQANKDVQNREKLTGWKQLKELFQEGLDPYDSGVFHQLPILASQCIDKSIEVNVNNHQVIGIFYWALPITCSFTPFSVLSTQLDVNKYLRPDVGLHWYLSIAMFNHFRLFVNLQVVSIDWKYQVFQHVTITTLPRIVSYLRHPVLAIFYGPCLLPAFHQLWMSLGSGDANFYYASTLVWAIANGL